MPLTVPIHRRIVRTLTWGLMILAIPVSPAGPQTSQPFQISVSVDLVVLHATVHDRKGRVATGLTQRDFTVLEDGVPQTLKLFRHEDLPVTVGLIVDHSGSMSPKLSE